MSSLSTANGHAPPTRRRGPSSTWLAGQLPAWQAEGLLDQDQADRISRRYHADSRFKLARLLLTIGAVFVGIGLIWLVAANIAAVDPTVRFVAVSRLLAGLPRRSRGARRPPEQSRRPRSGRAGRCG